MGLSVWQLLIIAAVILILFGRGKISDVMGDFGKGVKSFRQGMAEDEPPAPPRQIEGPGKADTRNSETKTPDSAKNS